MVVAFSPGCNNCCVCNHNGCPTDLTTLRARVTVNWSGTNPDGSSCSSKFDGTYFLVWSASLQQWQFLSSMTPPFISFGLKLGQNSLATQFCTATLIIDLGTTVPPGISKGERDTLAFTHFIHTSDLCTSFTLPLISCASTSFPPDPSCFCTLGGGVVLITWVP